MQQQLNNMQLQQLNPISIRGSRALNATNEDGTIVPFEIVLFVDGTDPTAPPHNLPALTSTAIIDALQGVQAAQYLNGYGLETAVNDRCSGVLGNHCHCDHATHVIIIMHTYIAILLHSTQPFAQLPSITLPSLLSWPSFAGGTPYRIHTEK
ncbi:hypothetical protein AX14_013610 [Amanita brunnescens Koide BX004]|nr:hypothetical protein AX14_013610 [Amanita brunnescens Koide BX004]